MAELEAVGSGEKKELPLSKLELAEFGPVNKPEGTWEPEHGDQLCSTAHPEETGPLCSRRAGSRRTEGRSEDSVYFLALPEDGCISFIHEIRMDVVNLL